MIRKFVRQSAYGTYDERAIYVMPDIELPDPGPGYDWHAVLFTEADGIMDGLIEVLVTTRRDGAALGPT